MLLLTDFFPPGFRAGGPVRSCLNVALAVGRFVPVQVITRNHDWGISEPYSGIPLDTWIEAPGMGATGQVRVWYASASFRRFGAVVRLIRTCRPSVVYLTGMFSVPFTIFPLIAHWLGLFSARVVLAPRGMLKASALQYKPAKKRVFLFLFRLLRLHRRVLFHATDEQERRDVVRVMGARAQVVVAAQVPELALLNARQTKDKDPEVLRLCMVARIHPIKNIHLALQFLQEVHAGQVFLDIIGPMEDPEYGQLCKTLAQQLPDHIQVVFHAAMPTPEVHQLLAQCDFFYLLTQGENFGHAIFEALALGKPVIISDQTPWRQLAEHRAGWDVALGSPNQISLALQTAAGMSPEAYADWSDGAWNLACQYAASQDWRLTLDFLISE
jgi:glycosyltransferase involved in cell wall biosynthesis